MPGSSLWLIPPSASPLDTTLSTLITDRIPSHFHSTKTHDFIPHITLTSNVFPSLHSSDPQAWLDTLDLPSSNITATVEALEPGDPFFKKLTLRVGRHDEGLRKLATECRARGVEGGDEAKARKWAESEYAPHCSLMYAELPKADVEAKTDEITKDLAKARSQLEADGEKVARGAIVVLVPTDRPIPQWEPIASREIKAVDWVWKSSTFEK